MAEEWPESSSLSGGEHERLVAARFLRANPAASAVSDLKAALARENVRWIRTALAEAIEACEGEATVSPMPPLALDESADALQAYADGKRDGLRTALHELTPLLGMARVAAEAELSPGSEVQTQLERMRAVSGALRQLVNASAVAERTEFDLSEVLLGFERSPPVPCPAGVVGTRGTTPFVVRGDRDLLGVAVQPVLANAIEAVLSVSPSPPRRSVMISWGADNDAYWIATIDSGPGPPPGGDAFALGATNKDGHFGFGLSTTRTAMESLGGSAAIERNSSGGATLLLRWPRTV
jgi:signal transduction histidine kinase